MAAAHSLHFVRNLLYAFLALLQALLAVL